MGGMILAMMGAWSPKLLEGLGVCVWKDPWGRLRASARCDKTRDSRPNAKRRTSEKIYSGMVEAERIVKGHLNAYWPQNNALEKLSKEIVANLMLNENYINWVL